MNNNPLKRKSEFYEDLEKVRKRKDNSIKKKKKGWIKKVFIDKDKIQNDINNKQNIITIKEEKSKWDIRNINEIDETSFNNVEEKKEEEKEYDFNDLNIFKNTYKRSQDDFDIAIKSNNIDINFNFNKLKKYLNKNK